jgi:hypothetical protein
VALSDQLQLPVDGVPKGCDAVGEGVGVVAFGAGGGVAPAAGAVAGRAALEDDPVSARGERHSWGDGKPTQPGALPSGTVIVEVCALRAPGEPPASA